MKSEVMKITLFNYLTLFFFLFITSNLFASPIGEITWTESFLSPEDHIPLDRLKFGYISVPEDYNKPNGKVIKVAFIVIKAAVEDPMIQDASIYFMGGWGSRTIKNLPFYKRNFLSKKRDLIIYDYRGTGYSEPRLCEEIGPKVFENLSADLSYDAFGKRQQLVFNECLDQLEKQGIDYNQYGTNNKARDAVLLAKALNYDSYNLFGVSYGTKTILQFIRQSEVKIRSVVMDSNCPLDFPINSGMTEDYVNSLDQILEDCKNDPSCNKRYANLREKLEHFLLSLDKKPLKIKLPKSRVAYLNRQEINGIIHQLLYDERGYGMIPFLLKKFSQGNKFIIKRIVRDLEEVLLDNYNGVGLINYVYDHKPFREQAIDLSKQSIEKYPAFQVFDGYQSYFFVDNRIKVDRESTQAVYTDIPTLIMAGEYDPITPVYYSKMVLKYFSHHYYVEFPHTGHGVSDNWCGQRLAENFINTLESPYENPCYEKVKSRRIVFER